MKEKWVAMKIELTWLEICALRRRGLRRLNHDGRQALTDRRLRRLSQRITVLGLRAQRLDREYDLLTKEANLRYNNRKGSY